MIWVFILAAALTMTGTVRAEEEPQFLYTATHTGTLYQYRIGADGTLHSLNPPGFPISPGAVMLAPHPSGRFPYAVSVHEANSGHDAAQVFSYRIKPDGTLAPLGYGPRTLAAPADNVTMDPKGRFLFVSGEDDHLFTFRIRHDGALVPLPDNKDVPTFHIDTQGDGGGEVTGTYNYDSLTFDPAGRFLYLYSVQYGFDSVSYQFYSFRLDAHGALHPLKSSGGDAEGGTGSIGPCFFTPLGDFLVSHDQGDKIGTNEFHIGSQGQLTPARTPFLPKQHALSVTNGLGGLTLWTSSTDASDYLHLASYRIGPGSRLTLKSASAASFLSYGTSAAADRTGRFLYLTPHHQAESGHEDYDTLSAYAVTAQGTLRALGTAIPVDGLCGRLNIVSSPTRASR